MPLERLRPGNHRGNKNPAWLRRYEVCNPPAIVYVEPNIPDAELLDAVDRGVCFDTLYEVPHLFLLGCGQPVDRTSGFRR